uniref:G-protein coupled receptors family 1 profile domain-containing protein n=1 Tax=Astyanax mexicanus TaxID=7994 RepID=W5L5B4_ASTMX
MIPLLINNSYKHEHSEGEFQDYMNQSTPFCSRFRDEPWYCSMLLVLFIISLPVGVLGNIVAILNYTCCRRSWTTGTVFLLNLALCDFTWLLVLPFTFYFTLLHPHTPNIHIFCQFKKIFFNINVNGSIIFLALISFDRYTGTVHPISSLRWWNSRKACLCCFCTWLLLLLGSIPDFFMAFAHRGAGNTTLCIGHMYGPLNYMSAISLVRMLVGFLLPLGVMGALYSRMIRGVDEHVREAGEEKLQGSERFCPADHKTSAAHHSSSGGLRGVLHALPYHDFDFGVHAIYWNNNRQECEHSLHSM